MSGIEKVVKKVKRKQPVDTEEDLTTMRDNLMASRDIMTIEETTPQGRVKGVRLWRRGVYVPLLSHQEYYQRSPEEREGAEIAPATLEEAVQRLRPGGILVGGRVRKPKP